MQTIHIHCIKYIHIYEYIYIYIYKFLLGKYRRAVSGLYTFIFKAYHGTVNLDYLVLYRVCRSLAYSTQAFFAWLFFSVFTSSLLQQTGCACSWPHFVDLTLTLPWLRHDFVVGQKTKSRLQPRLKPRLKAGESLAQFNWYRLARDDSLKFMRRKRKPRRRSCCRRQGADSQSSQAAPLPVPSSRFLGTCVLGYASGMTKSKRRQQQQQQHGGKVSVKLPAIQPQNWKWWHAHTLAV